MKHMGRYRVGCQCKYCAGVNNKKVNSRGIKKGERQRAKKLIKKEFNEHTGSTFDDFLKEEKIKI